MDTEEFRQRGIEMINFIIDYHSTVVQERITPLVKPGYLRALIPELPPEDGEEWDSIMKDCEKIILPGLTHWLHPHFHAFFPIGCSYPSLLGEIMSDALACNGFSWAASPSCTELESIVLDWLGEMIGLPDKFLFCKPNSCGGGALQGSASDCNLVVLLAARHHTIKLLQRADPTVEEGKLLSSLIAYCSQEAHSSVEKSAMICLVKLGILRTDSKYRLRGSILEEAIKKDIKNGYRPFFVTATIGTTSCGSCDKIDELGPICEKYDMWLHVDAAYGGNAMICPEMRHHLKGVEYVSSFNTNPTKWMLVNYDCSAMWVSDRNKFTECLIVRPLYLAYNQEQFALDYRHWGIPLSRRFRSLKLWFTIRSFGVRGLQEYIRNHIKLAKHFARHIINDKRFELENEVHFGLVCFRMKGSNSLNENLLNTINRSGELYMVAASLGRKYVIRFCICYSKATEEHVEYAWNIISKVATQLLEGSPKGT
ncbi:tyrosine decarboxylase [Nephila pilipes]|uniref:Tyrosine decarboxylase n=1 Tax=Nephila pilipes TaxID=299642 RepID=A0A8X6TKS9_NEPPI|nr:tyrosine decarboxylase [Nephila pilipes]